MKYCRIILILSFCLVKCIKADYFSIQDGQSTNDVGKIITKSGKWNIRKGGPFYPAKSGTMIQVKASGVELDLEKYAIENEGNKDQLVIGIEVGYSKAELEAHANLKQVSNVTIKNGCFCNFDVGIIVHEGVNTLTVQDCSFDEISSGIIFLGISDTMQSSTIRATVKNCTIIGHGKNKRKKLELLKNKYEELFDFTDHSFVYEQDLEIQEKNKDIYIYTGILASYVYGLTIDNVRIQNIGYQDYQIASEGEDRYTQAIGILIQQGSGVMIKDTHVYSCSSELKSVGIKIEGSRNVQIYDTECTYQKSARFACGIETIGDQDYQDRFSKREKTIYLKNVCCQLNFAEETEFTKNSKEIAAGIVIVGLFSVQSENLTCEKNIGRKKSYGFFAKNLINSEFVNSIFSQNKSNREQNDVNQNLGVVTTGCFIQDSESLVFRSCHFSNNVGKNTGIGLSLKNVMNTEFEDCNFSRNQGLIYKKDELNSLRNEQDLQEISNYAPVVNSSETGGCGCVINRCYRLGFEHCKAENNSGHRSAGFLCKNSAIISLQKTKSSYQHSYGDFLHSDIQLQSQGGLIADDYEIPVLDVHKSLLFDHLYEDNYSLSSINIVNCIDEFLSAVHSIRAKWLNDTLVSLEEKQKVVYLVSVLHSIIARFRLWGTAFGVHIHNCKGILIKDCDFSGQIAAQDNAAGCVVTGRSSDFHMEKTRLSYNCAWNNSHKDITSSLYPYESSYDLSSIKPLWNSFVKKFDKAFDKNEIGFYHDDNVLKAQGCKEFDGSGSNMNIIMKQQSYTFVNAIAPISSGLILADCCTDGTLSNNEFHANKGSSGYCCGLLCHKAENVLVQNNVINDNASNVYGNCFGLMDLNLYSENSYIKNYLSFNRVDGFYNAHSLILSDVRSKNSNIYPKVELNNNQATTTLTDLDNVEILFPLLSYSEKKESKKKDKSK